MNMTLTDTEPTIANLDLGTALPTTTVDVAINSPVAIATTLGAVQLGPNLAMSALVVNSPLTAHEFLMPVVNDATYGFVALTNFPQAGWQSGVTGSTATVVVPDPTTLISPATATTNVTNTTVFTASNPTEGPLTYFWSVTGGPIISVTTMATSHAIPDPAAYGMSIPPAANGTWQVFGSSGPSTEYGVSAIIDYYNTIFMLIIGSSPGTNGTGTFSVSEDWSFTTAP